MNNIVTRAETLYTEIPKVLNQFGYNYLDLSSYIKQTGTEYLQEDDLFSLNDLGYTTLTPYVTNEIKSMLGNDDKINVSDKNILWLGDSLISGTGDRFITRTFSE